MKTLANASVFWYNLCEYINQGVIMEQDINNEQVRPGIHPFASENVKKFSKTERTIVGIFKRQWYVTKADTVKIGVSEYNYMLIKAPQNLVNQFNIELEIIVVFSSYSKFEPRTLDAFEYINQTLEVGRTEKLCGVLISKDENLHVLVKRYNEGETRIIVPFSYNELTSRGNSDSYFIRDRFQNNFYNRDLFAFNDALKTDLYFFGRDQLVLDIINKHLSGENSGLFGLRKTGKTSIIFDVKRKILSKNAIGVFVSCQNPSISESNWIDAIYHVVDCIYDDVNKDTNQDLRKIHNLCEYSSSTATRILEDEINNIIKISGKSILLFFDEVEHITYKKASNKLWRDKTESVSFWKAIRSIYQKLPVGAFSFCIVGTNPVCIEYPIIDNVENPIFKAVNPIYIPGFKREQTRNMIRTLGKIMGVKFDESLYQRLTDDYGGHPFLIRHVCSYLSQKKSKPFEVSKTYYDKSKLEFNKNEVEYFDMILNVLQDFFKEEYELLKALAVDDIETFSYFAEEDPAMIKHLLGYDLIKKVDDGYEFNMEVIKDYLIRKERLEINRLETLDDKWKFLVTKRGELEIRLRDVVKRVLLTEQLTNSKFEAKKYVMKKIHNSSAERRKYSSTTYKDLFDADKTNIYFSNLLTLISGQWEIFAVYTDLSKEDFSFHMNKINSIGRSDAHAKSVSRAELSQLDLSFAHLERMIEVYNSKPSEFF